MIKNESQYLLPYHAEIGLLEKILIDLKTAGKEGVNLDTLWANVGAAKNTHRSYTLNLGKFLQLMDSDNTKVWLTDFGTTLRYMSRNERSTKLAVKMPGKYLSMFKWIREAEELRSNELKTKFIESWGSVTTTSTLDRMITTFLNYCDWLDIIEYQGRGNQAKARITDLGRQVLELPIDEIISQESKRENQFIGGIPAKENVLSEKASYPIKIITRDRDFEWDIKSDTDLQVIDSVITSIKEGWKKSKDKSPEVDNTK